MERGLRDDDDVTLTTVLFILIYRKPKESCTYLTDNFKSKCVQVYNYHRLLTWDQQNGLHMDIFKVKMTRKLSL